jgi:hypothetical protein
MGQGLGETALQHGSVQTARAKLGSSVAPRRVTADHIADPIAFGTGHVDG